MSPTALSPMLNRALVAIGLFTFASWMFILAALLVWAPGRGLAANAVSRMAAAATFAPATSTSLATTAMAGLVMTCDTGALSDNGSEGFAWRFVDRDGNGVDASGDGERIHRHSSGTTPAFWFRDQGDAFVVHDRAIVDEVREVTRPLRELGQEMGQVGGEMGRQGARMGRIGGRMGAVGARMARIQMRVAERSASREALRQVDADMEHLRAEMETLRAQLSNEQSGHAQRQRELSKRMSELSARHQVLLREVRERVRDIAARARREGKAERPHANA